MNIILYICVYSLDDELCLADSELVINPNTFQTGLDLDLYQPCLSLLRDGIKDGLFPSPPLRFL